MKKTLAFLILVAALILALTLTACGKSETTTSTTSSTDTTAPGSDTTPESTTANILVTAYDKPEEYITLPEFSTITVSNALINKDVEAYLEQVLGALGKDDFKKVDSGVSAILGDSVNIHYTGRAKDESVKISESTLAGMTNAADKAGYDLILGSGNFIPGFEEQLVGAKAGDTVTVDVTFPESYHSEELQGVAVLFEVKVNSISRATAGEENVLSLFVLYSLKNDTENSDLAAFMEGHGVELDMADLETPFDEYFSAEPIRSALLGKTLYGTATLEVTMPLSAAKEFGYDHELTLTAMITVEQIVFYPKELTDEDINAYTGGSYPTVEAYRKYVRDQYKVNHAYQAVMKAVTYGKIPDDVYALLYQPYYDQKIYELVGDISTMTEEELAEKLTADVTKKAEDFAKENVVAMYNDRMLTAYLAKKTNFVMTEAVYKESLSEMFNFYMTNYYFQMMMSNITTEEAFETYFGKDNLTFQFTFDEVVTLLADKVTYVD